MVSKNDEALTTCDSQGSLSNKSRKGNIDMIIVQNKELSFHNTNFSYMEMGGQVWLTAAEVGQALEYADDKAVQRIYSRHADEFTAQMTGVVKLTTPSGKQEARVFFSAWRPSCSDVCSHAKGQRVPPLGAGYSGSGNGAFADCEAVQ
ncbi:Uncharacterised protein (plasmid) [Klebsiella pneumoniae]|nr:Uncharacterised protein [Klebsiella pneumoniae]